MKNKLVLIIFTSFACLCANAQKLNLTIFDTSNTPAFNGNNFFTTVAVGKGGHIWAGTSLKGLYKFNGTVWEKAAVLTNNNINDIKTDKNGGIWIAQSGHTGAQAITGGVNYFPDSIFSSNNYYGATIGTLPSRNARSLFIDTLRNNGSPSLPLVWVATMANITGGESKTGAVARGLNAASPFWITIKNGVETANGLGSCQAIGGDATEIWVYAANNFGKNQLLKYDAATNAFKDSMSVSFQAKAIYFDGNGRKWIGTAAHGLIIYDGAVWHNMDSFYLFPGITPVNNNAITGDKEGNVYIGTTTGLIVYKAGPLDSLSSYERYTTDNGLPSSNIRFVQYDNAGNRLLMATDKGIAIWDRNEKIGQLKLLNPFPAMIDDEGYIKDEVKDLDTTKILKGIATDGNSKLILYVKSRDAMDFAIAAHDSSKGYLSQLDWQTNKRKSLRIDPIQDSIIALVYHAPDGYGEQYGLGTREVTITAIGFLDKTVKLETKIKLYPAPIVLVHGMWSKPAVWSEGGFKEHLLSSGFSNVQMADYEEYNHMTFDPLSTESIFGRMAVYGAIKQGLKKYEDMGILASKVDVVGHSLGGLMTRSFTQMELNISKRNFKQGYVNKLITLGTPHLGSPLGPLVYNLEDYVRIIGVGSGSLILTVLPVNSLLASKGLPVGSCHRDFETDISKNKALKNLTPTNLNGIKKVHAIVGIAGDGQDESMERWSKLIFKKPLATILGTNAHDLIVGEKSQLGGLSYGNTATKFPFTAHSNPPGLGSLGFETETSSKKIFKKVSELLQTSGSESFAPFFPAPTNAAGRPVDIPLKDKHVRRIFSNDSAVIQLSPKSKNINVTVDKNEIEITFELLNGASVENPICMIKDLGWFPFPEKGPYTIKIPIPDDIRPIGNLFYCVIARDTSGLLLADTSSIQIQPRGVFLKLEAGPGSVILDSISKTAHCTALAYYLVNGDTVIHAIDASAGLTFKNFTDRISVNKEGLIEALKPGIDSVAILFNGSTEHIQVEVLDNFMNSKRLPNSIIFSATDKNVDDPPFVLKATSLSASNIEFNLLSGPVELENGIIIIKGAGKVTLKASSKGDAYFLTPPDVIQTFCINPLQPFSILGDSTTCPAQRSYGFKQDTLTNYTWSVTGGYIVKQTKDSITVNWTGTGLQALEVKPELDGCMGKARILTVNVTAMPVSPVILASGATIICEGKTILLSSSATANNQWYKDGSIINGATNTTYTVSAQGNYSVKVSNSSGCSSVSIPVAVTVIANPPVPVITASGATTICEGSNVMLTSSSANGNQWQKDGVNIAGATNKTYLATASGNYSLTVTSAGSCGSASALSVTVTVINAPSKPSVTAAGATTFCEGGSVLLTSSAANNNQWYKDGDIINAATNTTYTATANGNYTVRVLNSNGCYSDAEPVIVSVHTIPAVPIITPGGATDFCTGGKVDISSSSAIGNQWLRDGTIIAGANNQLYSATATGTYSVKVTTAGGCSSVSASINVIVNNNPSTPVITGSGATSFCEGSNVVLTSSANGNQWLKNGTIIPGATGQSYTATEGGNYSVKSSTTFGCSSASAITIVTVKANPVKPVITRNAGDLVSAAPTGNQWFKEGNAINGAVNQVYRPSSTGNYSVQVTREGCVSIMSDQYNFPITMLVDTTSLDKSIHVYPNPVTDKITIVNQFIQPVELKLVDITGKQLKSIQAVQGTYEMDMRRMSGGTYLLLITDKVTEITIGRVLLKL